MKLRPALIAAAVLAVAAVGVILFLFASDASNEDTAQPVYERMLDGMSRPGMVLHTTFTVYDCDHTEAWIDTAADVVLEEFSYLCDEKEGAEMRTLRRDGKWWRVAPGENVQLGESDRSCRGAEAVALTFFMSCRPNEEVRLRVIDGQQYEGHRTVALRATGEFQGIDSRVEFDEYLYVDEGTGLPIALVRNIRDFYGGSGDHPTTERIVVKYSHEFLERSTLRADLFEPFAGARPAGEDR